MRFTFFQSQNACQGPCCIGEVFSTACVGDVFLTDRGAYIHTDIHTDVFSELLLRHTHRMRFSFWGFKLLACVYSRRWWSFHPRPPAFDPLGMEKSKDKLIKDSRLRQAENAFYFLGLQTSNVCLLASLVVISPQASSFSSTRH